jgi:putative acetyltransferase
VAAEVITVTAERACGVDATALMEDLDRDLLARYPHTSIHGIDAAQVDATGVFLVARRDGRAVGCGALRPLAPGIAEVKRMFVRDGARRRGIARRILGALEALARERDVVVLRLETGTRQPESMALYESAGYRRIACFGEYLTDPYSVCYEKHVAACGVEDR